MGRDEKLITKLEAEERTAPRDLEGIPVAITLLIKSQSDRIAELEQQRDGLSILREMAIKQFIAIKSLRFQTAIKSASDFANEAVDLANNAIKTLLKPLDAPAFLGPLRRVEELEAALADARDANKQAESFARGNVGIHWAEENDALRQALVERTKDLQRVLTVVDEGLGIQDSRLAVRDIEALRQERDALATTLCAIKEYLYEHEDIVDSEQGPRPNWALRMVQEFAEKFGQGSKILSARLAAERKAAKVAALKSAAQKCTERRWEKDSDDDARTWTYGQGCFDCSALIDAMAAQIESGEVKS